MERLTHARNSGIKTGYWSPNKKDELVERLAAYEDTGLLPEEVEELMLFAKNLPALKTAVPAVIQMQGWIPVTERLPEDDMIVLVTVDGEYNNITFCKAIQLGAFEADGGWIIAGFEEWENPDVLAWMPLPEPY